MENAQTDITGQVIVVMAPMGSGKGTIVRHALDEYSNIYHTISCTTRAKRDGEEEGVHYYFLSHDEFDRRVAAGDFLEWAEFAGNKYGTLKSEIFSHAEGCNIVLLEIELQGVEQLMRLIPRDHMTIVYIEAGGWEVLKERALARAPMNQAELTARHERYIHEEKAKPLADVIVDNSNDIAMAHAEFAQVIESVQKRCKV